MRRLCRDLIREFPLGEASLLHLISVSSICAARFVRHPEILLWLGHPEICAAPRGSRRDARRSCTPRKVIPFRRKISARFGSGRDARCSGSRCAKWPKSRRWRKQPSSCRSWQKFACAKFINTGTAELRSRRGAPEAEFAILGLGKLGGRELNHSSDIDVIFLYGEEGQVSPNLTYHEWFNLLGSKIAETFAAASPDGPLFRIDLRLRPEGTAGPLARSLESMENYYAGFGETWERLALIKARGICGSRELAYEFLRQHQPFIYPKSPTPDLLDEIAAIKRRIERDIVGHENIWTGRQARARAGFGKSNLSFRRSSSCTARDTRSSRKRAP